MNRRLLMIPPLFHTARTLSGSLRSPPSPRGEGFVRRYSFSTYACIRFDDAGIAASSYRCLPHWGRGTASAVDRVLSLIVDLRCISSLSFIPLPPSNLRPFGAPPSYGRRECPREPLPLEGAAERSEAGLASFFGRRSGTLVNDALETIFFALFHTARTLSGSLRSPPSPRGEGFVSGIPLSPSNLRPFGAPPSIGRRECTREPLPLEGAAERSEAGLASFFVAKPPPLCLPHWERRCVEKSGG